MTTLVEARQALYAEFRTAWGTTTPYVLDNESFTPPESAPWVRAHMKHFFSEQETLGAPGGRRFARLGRMMVQIFVPSDTGTKDADSLSHQARAIFEGRSIAGTTIRFFAVETREVGPDKKWFQVVVDARFEYDETK